jgi:hypothetical protein
MFVVRLDQRPTEFGQAEVSLSPVAFQHAGRGNPPVATPAGRLSPTSRSRAEVKDLRLPAVAAARGGALSSRSFGPLSPAAQLSHSYDRRGRGDSTDTPYAVEREVGDLETLIAHPGGEARDTDLKLE